MSSELLSAKQQQILNYLSGYQSAHGYPPSVREICDAIGLSSTSTVHGHLGRLERKGYIRRDPSKPRAIEILKSGTGMEDDSYEPIPEFSEIPEVETAVIPVIGRVTAGQPILATENVEDYFVMPLNCVKGSTQDVFMLKVRGESMIRAGILDGDRIVVRKQSHARNGEIVVALIDDSATCKRYYRENDFIRLQPENENMSPIYVKDASILGKVIGVFRQID